MKIRPEVQALIRLGRFPASEDADEKDIDHRGTVLNSIKPPLTDEEAAALLPCFGPDEAYGLAWTLIHLIETAPGGSPVKRQPPSSANEWIILLWDRAHR